jgi:hypothetical protein
MIKQKQFEHGGRTNFVTFRSQLKGINKTT